MRFKKSRKFLGILVMGLMLQACASNVQKYAEVDQNNKTVTVPIGSKGLKGELKKALVDDGWKLSVYRGADITKGTIGENTKLEQFNTFNTRYTLTLVSEVYDICLNLSSAISYDISLIDNDTGSEVFTMSGNGCEGGVVTKFMEALNGQTI